jgi:hypothetical protein
LGLYLCKLSYKFAFLQLFCLIHLVLLITKKGINLTKRRLTEY